MRQEDACGWQIPDSMKVLLKNEKQFVWVHLDEKRAIISDEPDMSTLFTTFFFLTYEYLQFILTEMGH